MIFLLFIICLLNLVFLSFISFKFYSIIKPLKHLPKILPLKAKIIDLEKQNNLNDKIKLEFLDLFNISTKNFSEKFNSLEFLLNTSIKQFDSQFNLNKLSLVNIDNKFSKLFNNLNVKLKNDIDKKKVEFVNDFRKQMSYFKKSCNSLKSPTISDYNALPLNIKSQYNDYNAYKIVVDNNNNVTKSAIIDSLKNTKKLYVVKTNCSKEENINFNKEVDEFINSISV